MVEIIQTVYGKSTFLTNRLYINAVNEGVL